MAKQKVILITGASSGIGRALALAYAAADVTLLLAGRDEKRLNGVAADARARGARVEISAVPVTDRAGFAGVVAAWDDAHPVDTVIANAGISGGLNDAKDFYEIVDTNLNGTLNTVLPLLPRLQARKGGHVVLMSSMAGWRGMPNAPAYSTSKVAVRALGDALRPLLARQGVVVSVIFPGFIETPLTAVNRFPMPFLMTAEKAAACIRKGLEKKRSYIAFPWTMMLLSRAIACLPRGLGDAILMRAPKK